jgi:carbonic anhydrase/acetyltransferase-like protein (isoleucine patch superfamily)
VSRHQRLVSLDTASPVVAQNVWVAPSAAVVGDVTIGEGSSVWYGAVIRGDVNCVRVGQKTSIGDRVVIHCAEKNPKGPRATEIGDQAIIGEGALLHACTVQSGAVVGIGAVVMDHAVVESGAVVAPGAVVTEGKVVRANEYWVGNPAKCERAVSAEERAKIAADADAMYKLSKIHQLETVRNPQYEELMDRVTNNLAYYAPN